MNQTRFQLDLQPNRSGLVGCIISSSMLDFVSCSKQTNEKKKTKKKSSLPLPFLLWIITGLLDKILV